MDNRKWIIENNKANKHLFSIFHFRSSHKAQVVMEFTFCMIVLFLMIYGLLQIFQWTGLDLADRRKAHDALLTSDIDQSYGECTAWDLSVPFNPVCVAWEPVGDGPLKQIDPYFFGGRSMNAVWSEY